MKLWLRNFLVHHQKRFLKTSLKDAEHEINIFFSFYLHRYKWNIRSFRNKVHLAVIHRIMMAPYLVSFCRHMQLYLASASNIPLVFIRTLNKQLQRRNLLIKLLQDGKVRKTTSKFKYRHIFNFYTTSPFMSSATTILKLVCLI